MLKAGHCIASYVIVSHIADGGTSEVYLVRERGHLFALKILKECLCHLAVLQARLLNEAIVLESLRLDGVVRVFGNGDFQGRPYFVMEYLPATLAQRLRGPLPLAEVLPLARELADVLGALHARGIVHRDVKPQNILFTQAGELRLTDLGHAKLPVGDAPIPHSTETGAFLGTRDYAAPEQLLDAKAVDGRADVYALGVVLYEALCGHRPFTAASHHDQPRQRLTRRAPRLSTFAPAVPPKLDRLLGRMLECSPQNRPTACEVAAQLASVPRYGLQRAGWWRYAAIAPLLMYLSWPLGPRNLSDFSEVLDERPLKEAAAFLYAVGKTYPSPLQEAKLAQKWADLQRERGELAPAAANYAEACRRFYDLGRSLARDQANCATRLADMRLHQGDATPVLQLHAEAQSLRNGRAARKETTGGEEYYFTPYHLGLFYLHQGDREKARRSFLDAKDAATRPLWLARTEERLAALPGTPDALALAEAARQHAEAALRQDPASQRAQMVLLRARFRLGVLRPDPSLQQAALQDLIAVWSSDKEQGLWAHDLLELLIESKDRNPLRTDLRAQALTVLAEMDARAQWQGDVHVERWRQQLSALSVARNGVIGR